MARRALIVSGGWDGHHPAAVAGLFKHLLEQDGFEVILSNSLDSFADSGFLKSLSAGEIAVASNVVAHPADGVDAGRSRPTVCAQEVKLDDLARNLRGLDDELMLSVVLGRRGHPLEVVLHAMAIDKGWHPENRWPSALPSRH